MPLSHNLINAASLEDLVFDLLVFRVPILLIDIARESRFLKGQVGDGEAPLEADLPEVR
jgi:hypothetical protein